MRDIALILHVAAGVVAIVFGPLAIVLTLRRRGLNWAGEVYHWAIALVCVTALVMVPYDWDRLWFFWPITIASYLFVYSVSGPPKHPAGSGIAAYCVATAVAGSLCGQRLRW